MIKQWWRKAVVCFAKMLRRLQAFFIRPFRKGGLFFFTTFLLGLLVRFATETDALATYPDAFHELFFDVYALTFILSWLPKRLRRAAFMLTYAVFFLLAFIDTYCYEFYGSTINPSMLLLLDETNAKEASEFLAGLDISGIFTSAPGAVLLILLLRIIFEKRRKIARSKIFKAKWRRKLKVEWGRMIARTGMARWSRRIGTAAVTIFSLAAFGGAVYCGQLTQKNKENVWEMLSMESVGRMEKHFNSMHKAQLHQPFYRLCYSLRANQLMTQQTEILLENQSKIQVDSCDFCVPDIVLVIGESCNKRHSQLFGYKKSTTPRQVERERRGELIALQDVVTSWNLTSFAFKNMLSLYAIGDKGDWCDYSLFPALFRKAGYKVFFLTNQFLPKANDAVFDTSGGFFLNDDSLSAIQFDFRNNTLYKYDEQLLAAYDSLAINRGQNNLTIFHLYGQHMGYKNRFPESRAVFHSKDYDIHELQLSKSELQTMVDYDNATLYNDSILDAIIRRYEDKSAIVISLPDHGEEIYGNHYHKIGRIHNCGINAEIAREEYEIPVWIWGSKRLRNEQPELWRQIKAAKTTPWMSDQIPHLLIHLAGIHTKEYREDLDPLAGERYNAKRPRKLRATTDYNILKR